MRKGSTFAKAREGMHSLAIRPSALSLFWLFGCGVENENVGRSTVVTIDGPLEQRAGWWDGYDAIAARFREALKDDTTSSVILRVNSPGGDAAGCFEAVRTMRAMAEKSGKRVVTYVDEAAYSAAYALACVSDEIYTPESGGVGSVGVIATCIDRVQQNEMVGINVAVIYAGAHKADCHPDVPLSEAALSGVQDDVDRLASLFYETVSSARGIKVGAVEALEASTFMGDEALAAGLADGIMGFDELVTMLASDIATGAAAPSTTEKVMPKGKKLGTKASDVNAIDVLAKPQVAIPDAATLAAARGMLGHDAGAPAAGSSKTDGTSSETTVETESETDDEGNCTNTTTTTTTETETTGAEVNDDEEESDDEESDGEEETDAIAARAEIPSAVSLRSTSGDVLKAVRELTGSTSPAEQIGALRAMSDNGKRAAKAEKKAAKADHVSKVEAAIRVGKLSPAKKAEALAMSPSEFAGYMRLAIPMVHRAPMRPAANPKAAAAAATAAAPSIDAATLAVAKTMGLDPAKLAEHAAELRKAGVFH